MACRKQASSSAVIENEKTAREHRRRTRAGDEERRIREARPKVTLENLFDTLASEQNKILKSSSKRIPGFGRSDRRCAQEDRDRQSFAGYHSQRGRNDHRIGCHSGFRFEPERLCSVPYPHRQRRVGRGQAGRRADQALRDHLRVDRPGEGSDGRLARSADSRKSSSARRKCERFSAFRRAATWPAAWSAVAASSKGKMRVMRRKGLIYEGVSLTLATLSGRSERSSRRHGMRYSARWLRRFSDRRRDRVLHAGESAAEAVRAL